IFAMYVGFPAEDRLFVFQCVIQGLVVGSIYVLGASGLSLTYGIKKFANFAHGDMMTVGMYAAFTVNVLYRRDIIWGFLFAMLTVAMLGVLLELSIFRRLERRGEIAALIASVGVSLVLQNVISVIFLTEVSYLNVIIPQDFSILNTGLTFYLLKGGFIIGIVEKLSNVLFGELGKFGLLEGGAAWEPAGAFVVMILVLLIKPEGLMGRRRAAAGPRWLIARRVRKEATAHGD